MFIGEVVETGVIEPLVVPEVAEGAETSDAGRTDRTDVQEAAVADELVPLEAA